MSSAQHGGFVAKYMGDGALIYFGYPQAHENDAERAVRAGLALVEGISELTAAGERLSARVGIATGLVVVGDLVGAGEAQERGIAGETPNLAARLQGLAEPGAVVIADSDAAASRRPVRARRARAIHAQGLRRTGAGLAGDRRGKGGKPI